MDNKPLLTPLAAIFRDEKFVLVLIYIVVQVAILAVPALAAYADMLTKIAVILFGGLLFHQGVEDALDAWNAYQPTDLTAAVQAIIAELLPALLSPREPLITPPSTTTTTVTTPGVQQTS